MFNFHYCSTDGCYSARSKIIRYEHQVLRKLIISVKDVNQDARKSSIIVSNDDDVSLNLCFDFSKRHKKESFILIKFVYAEIHNICGSGCVRHVFIGLRDQVLLLNQAQEI